MNRWKTRFITNDLTSLEVALNNLRNEYGEDCIRNILPINYGFVIVYESTEIN